MIVKRHYWQEQIESAWERRSILWLAGVRRAGKTNLCLSLENVEYYDCELPRVRQLFDDPESFFKTRRKKRIVLDEIHRLDNPSEVLKIAADHFPDIKIIATGSSTLGASSKFKDTLTGRKTEIWLTPMLFQEKDDFGEHDIKHRLLYGGLPSFFLSKSLPEKDYQEWLDAFWAKDIQELFKLEKQYSFKKFAELLLAQSGGIFEANSFTTPCEISRQTVSNYLAVLEATYVAHVIRPFNTHRSNEITSAPKVYGFDTGFICFAKGWEKLQQENCGILWEHIVLNEMQGSLQTRAINYWRDKKNHEIDFILPKKRDHEAITIECKWNAKNFDASNIKIFRKAYPAGENYVVAFDITQSYTKKIDDIEVQFVSLTDLIVQLKNK